MNQWSLPLQSTVRARTLSVSLLRFLSPPLARSVFSLSPSRAPSIWHALALVCHLSRSLALSHTHTLSLSLIHTHSSPLPPFLSLLSCLSFGETPRLSHLWPYKLSLFPSPSLFLLSLYRSGCFSLYQTHTQPPSLRLTLSYSRWQRCLGLWVSHQSLFSTIILSLARPGRGSLSNSFRLSLSVSLPQTLTLVSLANQSETAYL